MFKVIVGLITTERMIYFALGAIGLYFIWVSGSLLVCFQRRFYRNSIKLHNFARRNQLDPSHPEVIDRKCGKISKGFFYGWRKFKMAEYGKPSEFITRREALDVEVNGGVLNQGKSFMKAFIGFVSVFLFVFNLAYVSGHEGLSLYLLAEALVLPLILYVILKLFYYIYTSIKQQLYKQDVEVFYDLILVLDETFSKAAPKTVVKEVVEVAEPVKADVQEELAPETEEVLEEAENTETVQEESVEEVEETEVKKGKTIDDYDVFKKKNIDVDKLINEVPQSGTTLPYIDVDSDYVIKDDETPLAKSYSDKNNGSDVLGGMMQDMSSIKKTLENQNFIDVDKEVATIDKEKTEKSEKSEESEESSEESDPAEVPKEVEETNTNGEDLFGDLSAFEVKTENVETESVETKEEPVEEKVEEPVQETKEEPIEEKVEEPVVVKPSGDEITDEAKENIANLVSGFKSNRSKLANGGVVIERHETHHPRKEYHSSYENEGFISPAGITRLETNEDETSVLNSIKGSTSVYDNNGYDAPTYDVYGGMNPMYGQGYTAPYNQGYAGYGAGYVQTPQQPYMQPTAPTYDMNAGYNQGYAPSYQEQYVEEEVYEEDDAVDVEEAMEVIKEARKATKSKKVEPVVEKKSSKKEKAVMEEVKAPEKTRGRPKKQVFDETLTIKSDKEFNQVLSRAEKLMRKSDEGLSASQSKRIEKELKMLMDAMNRYKEGK